MDEKKKKNIIDSFLYKDSSVFNHYENSFKINLDSLMIANISYLLSAETEKEDEYKILNLSDYIK